VSTTGNTAIDVIDRQDWIDGAADRVQPAIRQAYASAGPAGQVIKDALHGTWLGHPVHSAITDVPVGAWTAAAVFDAFEASGSHGFQRAADLSVAVGLAGAVGAAVTGATDWSETDGRARRIAMVHGLLNASATMLYGASLLLRRRGARTEAHGLARLGYALVIGSAYLGGHLVYGERVGVDHSAPAASPGDFTRVADLDEVPESNPTRVLLLDTPLVVVRRGHEILALADRCAHFGGPLSDGDLQGDTISCPWHGSTFCLRSGEVLLGPSTHPQPTYEGRVRAGAIEVRARRG
jgi:nitrite reductase/ring-hydroxylating ferredoxin subunit/uncharacterized membrane protein